VTNLPEAWHELTEFEVAAAHAAGYRLGLEHARLAVDAVIAEVIAGQPDAAKAIVERLVRGWDVPTARAYIRTGPDHPGGPAPWPDEPEPERHLRLLPQPTDRTAA
jgi:hypothetical protein